MKKQPPPPPKQQTAGKIKKSGDNDLYRRSQPITYQKRNSMKPNQTNY